jgi:hypothetical protein
VRPTHCRRCNLHADTTRGKTTKASRVVWLWNALELTAIGKHTLKHWGRSQHKSRAHNTQSTRGPETRPVLLWMLSVCLQVSLFIRVAVSAFPPQSHLTTLTHWTREVSQKWRRSRWLLKYKVFLTVWRVCIGLAVYSHQWHLTYSYSTRRIISKAETV